MNLGTNFDEWINNFKDECSVSKNPPRVIVLISCAISGFITYIDNEFVRYDIQGKTYAKLNKSDLADLYSAINKGFAQAERVKLKPMFTYGYDVLEVLHRANGKPLKTEVLWCEDPENIFDTDCKELLV